MNRYRVLVSIPSVTTNVTFAESEEIYADSFDLVDGILVFYEHTTRIKAFKNWLRIDRL